MIGIKEIKKETELEEYTQYCTTTPYSNNKIKYLGKIWYIIGLKVFPEESLKGKLIEDYFHEGYYFYGGEGLRVRTALDIRESGVKFSKKNSDTWVRISYNDKYREETLDKVLYDDASKHIICMYSGNTPLVVIKTDDEMTTLGFIKSKSSEYWFHKTEADILDTYLPYRKFDNTYRAIDIRQGQEDMKIDGESPEKISSWVTEAMKDNLLFGVDSLSYSIFEKIEYTFGRRKIS